MKEKEKKKKENSEYSQMSFFDFLEESFLTGEAENAGEESASGAIAGEESAEGVITGAEPSDPEIAEGERVDPETVWTTPEEVFTQGITSMELPMDWENFYASDPKAEGVHAQSIADGFVKCLNNKGCVDIEYIAYITGEEYKTVIEKLKGSIYQNPETWGECFFEGWETADEYLSGNIRKKLKVATEMNEAYNGYFAQNVEALSKIVPPTVSAENIYVTLGSPWVPTDVIEDFLRELTGNKFLSFHVYHDENIGTWEVETFAQHFYFDYGFKNKYGTPRRDAYDIFQRTLNMQSVAVMDTVKSEFTKSGKQSVLNKEETVLALEKQKLLIKDFQDWIWQDEKRRGRLERIYEEKYCGLKKRHFNGSFLEFPDLNPEIALYPYQRDAVARILFTPNTLLAHDVGSGKTYVMIAAGMELKRMGLSQKNLYVVPNNLVGQWCQIFREMYPAASIKCVEPHLFTPGKRQKELEDIRDGEYAAVIMAYSCFSQIPVSNQFLVGELHRELEECRNLSKKKAGKTTKKLGNLITKLSGKVVEQMTEKEQEGICFDQLGITRLFVDEAHNFKNVPVETKIDMVMGINKAGSTKCRDMLDKVHIVQQQNGGGGVVFATGTPITNSVTDAFVMQQYLQGGELKILELENFDSWVGMFAEKSTNFEIDVDTSNYRLATRFSKFHNIPELTAMLASFSDFHQMDETAGVPGHDGYQDVSVPKTRAFSEYLKQISERAETVRKGRVSRTQDNMLKITTDGRQAALDIRLVNDKEGFTTSSKVFRCAENVAEIYRKTMDQKSTQLVFCDTSTPKEGFNVYDELRGILEKMGVASKDIAYVHDATTEKKRDKLFEEMRQGKLRILIGSTFKLGLGVNVQDRLIALHHLDVPWRPADMSQREGRILRQGNQNEFVWIYRYVTEGSFDAYSWQLLETKARFIADLLSGSVKERSGSDIDDTVLNYAEVKALAVGNPLIRERVEAANELSRYAILQSKVIAKREQQGKELQELPGKIRRLQEILPLVRSDAENYEENYHEYSEEERREIRKKIHENTHSEEPLREETVLLTYQGFQVVVPENCSVLNPVVYLRRGYEYLISLGNSDVGGLLRIDNYLEKLAEEYEKLKLRLEDYQNREAFLQKQLDEKAEDYSGQIAQYRKKVEELDHLLGVDKQ